MARKDALQQVDFLLCIFGISHSCPKLMKMLHGILIIRERCRKYRYLQHIALGAAGTGQRILCRTKMLLKSFACLALPEKVLELQTGPQMQFPAPSCQLPVPARVGSLLRLLLHRMCNFQGDTSRERRKLCLCFEILCSLLSQLRQANNNRNKHKLVCAGVCTTSKFPRKR